MEPYAYGMPTDIQNRVFEITPHNVPSLLIVFLCLTSDPRFLDALEGVDHNNPNFDFNFRDAWQQPMNVTKLAQITNLTEKGVREIISELYLGSQAKGAVADVKLAFRKVATQFATFESARVHAWEPSFCPGVIGISALARSGAAADPLHAPGTHVAKELSTAQ